MIIGNYATSAALIGSFYGKPARAAPISAKYRARAEMLAGKTEKPYGAWPSPVTAKFITGSSTRLGSLALDDKDGLHWLEGRPQEKGRQAVVRYEPSSPSASERGAVDVTPSDVNVRTRVHEYGGGAYAMAPSSVGGGVVYSDFMSQRLYHLKGDGSAPVCLTPEATCPDGRYRFADGCFDPTLGYVCVREDHLDPKPANVVNEVVAVPLDGSGDVRLLATGADFFAHPRVSPDGSRLAYVAWDHPNMPWDATELRVAAVAAGSPTERGSHRLVAGGEAADSSVLQPAWHPQSGALYYVDDSSGYYNLRRLAAANVDSGAAEPRAARRTDFGGGSPGWSLGQQGYTFLADGRVAATVKDGATGESRLLTFADSDADEAVTESGPADGLPHSFGGLCAAADGTIYMLGGSPAEPAAVYSWQFGGRRPSWRRPRARRWRRTSSRRPPPSSSRARSAPRTATTTRPPRATRTRRRRRRRCW